MADDAVRIDVDLADLKAEKSLKDLRKESGKTFKSFEKDTKRGTKAAKRFGGAVSGLRGKLVGFFSVAAGIGIGRKAVRNFFVQERAVNRLDAALLAQGQTTALVRREMEEYAAALQQVTVHGDEALLSGMALATAFDATTEQAKELVKQAANLAFAYGITLETAITQMARTGGGLAGELGEKLPELLSLSKAQLRDFEVIRVVREKFGGFAQREADSKEGRFIQKLNELGDALEPVGERLVGALLGIVEKLEGGGDSDGPAASRRQAEAFDRFLETLPGGKPKARRFELLGDGRHMEELADQLEREKKKAEDAEGKRQRTNARVNALLRGSDLGGIGDDRNQRTLDRFVTLFDNADPKGVASILEEIRTPIQKLEEDLRFLRDVRAIVAEREGVGQDLLGEGPGKQAGEIDTLIRRTEFFGKNPIVTQFSADLGNAIQASTADGLRLAFAGASAKQVITGFAQGLGQSVLDNLSEALAAALTRSAGLDAEGLANLAADVFGSSEPAVTP